MNIKIGGKRMFIHPKMEPWVMPHGHLMLLSLLPFYQDHSKHHINHLFTHSLNHRLICEGVSSHTSVRGHPVYGQRALQGMDTRIRRLPLDPSGTELSSLCSGFLKPPLTCPGLPGRKLAEKIQPRPSRPITLKIAEASSEPREGVAFQQSLGSPDTSFCPAQTERPETFGKSISSAEFWASSA